MNLQKDFRLNKGQSRNKVKGLLKTSTSKRMRDISVRKRVTAINIKITKSYNFFIMICASMC